MSLSFPVFLVLEFIFESEDIASLARNLLVGAKYYFLDTVTSEWVFGRDQGAVIDEYGAIDFVPKLARELEEWQDLCRVGSCIL